MLKTAKIIIVMLSLIYSMNAMAVQTEKMEKMESLKVKGKVPQGVTIMKNKVMVKPGYVVTKVSDNKATVMLQRNNTTTGSFECSCSAGGGGCKVVIEGNSITCVEGGGCIKGACEMSTTIPAVKVMY